MKQANILTALMAACSLMAGAVEYHVTPTGNDAAKGLADSPFRTINHAAQVALPGDTITVHNGTYREWINPLSGGESEAKRILYRVAPGEKAEVKGSEIVTGWKLAKGSKSVWTVTLPNSFFAGHNPFNERLYGDWLWSNKYHHTADVYINDVSLYEAFSKDKVFSPDTLRTKRDPQGSTMAWWAEVDAETTTIYANFGGANPNKATIEVNVRPTCFYPTRQGLNYITIRGFHFSQAATQWAAPTAEQVGMVSTHWCKGWIIEDNVVKNSRAVGITLGKERSSGHNLECNDPRLDGALHYIEVIFNTLRRGWNRDMVGSHIVRNNIISDCEQAGIVGSMGGAFCEIYNNHIYNILVKQQFGGAEMAGIKLHGAIDVYIHNNRIHNSGNFGIWLDWMAQGARISSNLFYDNNAHDIFIEVSHGPYVIDNNIMLSHQAFAQNTDGGAIMHNLMLGEFMAVNDNRYTPYQLAHSTEVKGFSTIQQGDHRLINNIIVAGSNAKAKYGTAAFNESTRPVRAENNLMLNGAKGLEKGKGEWAEDYNPDIKVEETADGEVYLSADASLSMLSQFRGTIVDTKRLVVTKLTGYPFDTYDGKNLIINADYYGNSRGNAPVVGPFEKLNSGNRIKVWPNLAK
ncbi:MAG: right-handed parallel beta-helix repeat-containing protein [Muribaculaceae bacterium]